MDALTRSQVWNLPMNIITSQNRKWRDLIKINDPTIKNINNYVIHNIPELAYQFKWEGMTDNQRLQEKFKYRNNYDSLRHTGHYDGYHLDLGDE
jgi:hypothetical protein